MVLRRRQFNDTKKTGKQAVGCLQLFLLKTAEGNKWYKSRMEALRICDELNLSECTCYTVKNNKPIYVALDMLTGNYTVEVIPMQRSRNYNHEKNYEVSREQREQLLKVGINVDKLSKAEILEIVSQYEN
jgi:hypothetical protein